MTEAEVMDTLRAQGTEQNRKVYRRHGASDPLFGVSYADLGKLQKKIKRDQLLAEQLWATGNHDARVLATMIADPARMTAAKLDAWVKEAEGPLISAIASLAVKTPIARQRVEKWIASRQEKIAAAGWALLASLASQDSDLSDADGEAYLQTIEANLQTSANRVRYAMNSALIAIGVRNSKLENLATAAAKRIGKVEVDHGETGCKTPDAVAYIKKTVAHRKARAQKA